MKGIPIAQFWENLELCSRCRIIADNMILISMLSTACASTYFLKLVKMPNEGTLVIRKVRPENQGNYCDLEKPQIEQPLICQVKVYNPIEAIILNRERLCTLDHV